MIRAIRQMQERAQTMEPETPAPREDIPATAPAAPAPPPLVVAYPARCVTLRRAGKACAACVEACPTACLKVEGNAVTVNEAACVECGGAAVLRGSESCDPEEENDVVVVPLRGFEPRLPG